MTAKTSSLHEKLTHRKITAELRHSSATEYGVDIFANGVFQATFRLNKGWGSGTIEITVAGTQVVCLIQSESRKTKQYNTYVGDYAITLFSVGACTAKGEAVKNQEDWFWIPAVLQPLDCTKAKTGTKAKPPAPVIKWTEITTFHGATLLKSDDNKMTKWKLGDIEYVNYSQQTMVETYVCSPLNTAALTIEQVKEELGITETFHSDLKFLETERTILAELRKITASTAPMVTIAKELATLCLSILSDKDLDEVYDRVEKMNAPTP